MEKIGLSIRKSRIGLFNKPPLRGLPKIATPPRKTLKAAPPVEDPLPAMEEAKEDDPPETRDGDCVVMTSNSSKAVGIRTKEVDLQPPIRWRKGELIGCGAFGRVQMGMNLDSAELLAVKEVYIVLTF